MPDLYAVIPARKGSKRVPGKNVRVLGGKPLIQWTVETAIAADLCKAIIVSTDDPAVRDAVEGYPVDIQDRYPAHATDDAPDYWWMREVATGLPGGALMTLRPTSPFRNPGHLRNAWRYFLAMQPDSLRDMRPVAEPPQKMWVQRGDWALPLLPFSRDDVPWHSRPTQHGPSDDVYVQTSALEIVWRSVVMAGSISGARVLSYSMPVAESFTIDTEADWQEAERRLFEMADAT